MTKVRPFRFAVQAMPDGRDAMAALAPMVERLGYDELFTADHLGAADPFLPLLIAAEVTTTLRFGPLVINNEFHNPGLLARTAATFDRLSGGRLVLGMGTGYAQDEHDALGIELRPPGARVERFTQTIGALRSLLDTGAADLDGHDKLAIGDLGVQPAQDRVPLLIGGNGRRVISGAAAHADIFQFTGLVAAPDGSLSPAGFEHSLIVERRNWLAAAAGARFANIELSALVQLTAIGADVGKIRQATIERWNGDEELLDRTPFALVGTVDGVCDKLESLRAEIGISHYVVRDPEGFAPIVERLAGR